MNSHSNKPYGTQASQTSDTLNIASYYAFTINVYPYQLVKQSLAGREQKWCNYSYDEQKDILVHYFLLGCHENNRIAMGNTIWEFEKTKAGHCHMHGMLRCTQVEALVFQQVIHKHLGYVKADPQRVCYIEKTHTRNTRWVEYMRKEQAPNKLDINIIINK